MHCKFCGDDSSYGLHCKICGSRDVKWLRENGRFILMNTDDTQHSGQYGSCRPQMATRVDEILPTTKVETNGHKPELNDEIKRQVVSAAGDVAVDMILTVQKASEHEQLKLSRLLEDAYKLVGGYALQARNDAVTELKSLLPVKHEIHLHNNGHSKVIDSLPHYKLGLLTQVVATRTHVMLVGPAGSGKTTAASQVAACLGLEYYEQSMGPATSQWDLVGFRNVHGEYVEGVLRQPFEHGGLLMLDELDNTNPSVLTALNAALSNDHYQFPDGMIARHKDFVLVGAGNTYGQGADRVYVGRNQLDGATLDRFAVIDWDYDEQAELHWAAGVNVEHEMLDWECVDCVCDDSEWVRYVQKVRKYIESQSMRVIVSPRASIYGVRLLEAGVKADLVADMVLWKGMSNDDRQRTLSAVGEYR